MGVAPSRFRRSIECGDESSAMRILHSSWAVRRFLNPHHSYGPRHNNNTYLHFAALYGMKNILRTLLYEFGGNPNGTNGKRQTCLHLACKETDRDGIDSVQRRAACVKLLIEWRGTDSETGAEERVHLSALDEHGNTALHLAAASGLEECVRALMNAGSSLYKENNDKLTPCDLAVQNKHFSLALMLEANMVFNDDFDYHSGDMLNLTFFEDDELCYSFNIEDLLSPKFYLRCQTTKKPRALSLADVLRQDNDVKLWMIPENYRSDLIEAWVEDLQSCLDVSEVKISRPSFRKEFRKALIASSKSYTLSQDLTCSICLLRTNMQPVFGIQCKHYFCNNCWQEYLTKKITSETAPRIYCPAHKCGSLIPNLLIESLVEPRIAYRYNYLNIRAFVDRCNFIKWCPEPDCGMAVRLSESEYYQTVDLPYDKKLFMPSRTVECGNGHFFCWNCMSDAHPPCGCIQWQKWMKQISKIDANAMAKSMRELEEISNILWLASNSKPCPGCRSPIQKHEGCNHIKCAKCKFEFCWYCLGAWDGHSSATGGYFRCNKSGDASKVDKMQKVLIRDTISKGKDKKDLRFFLFSFTKFRRNENTLELEKEYFDTIDQKIQHYESFLLNRKETPENIKEQTRFLKEGMLELVRLRRTVSGSYVYIYYLRDQCCHKKFRLQQADLEAVTEKLSETIARPYLKTARTTIVRMILHCRRKRYKFLRFCLTALLAQNAICKCKEFKHSPPYAAFDFANEDDWNPFSFTSFGSSELNYQLVTNEQERTTKGSTNSWLDFNADETRKIFRSNSDPQIGLCCTDGCNRPRAINRQTLQFNDYCYECERNQPNDFPSERFKKKAWKSLKILRKKFQITEDETRKGKTYSRPLNDSPFGTPTSQDGEVNGAAALSVLQQKSNVGGTIERPISQGTGAERSADYSKTDDNLKDELDFVNLVDDGVQAVADIFPGTYSEDTENLYDVFGFNQSEDEFLAEDDSSTSCSEKSGNQLVSYPQDSTTVGQYLEVEDEPTILSPKVIRKKGCMKRSNAICEDKYT